MERKKDALLVVENVTLREQDTERISFFVERKGIHGILGHENSGKSALLCQLAGVRESEGEILLLGERLSADAAELRARIGYVPASPTMDGGMTVLETLDFAGLVKNVSPDKRVRQIKEAIELLGLESVKKRLVSRLNEAEKWRLALGIALLGAPELLLFEEPLTAADTDECRTRKELLTMLGGVKTVILSTSSFALAKELCADVLLLSEGKCLANGSFEELESALASNGSDATLEELYRQLCVGTAKRGEEATA